MPKTPFDKYRKPQPKAKGPDMGWALVLVRKEELGLDMKQIAEAADLSYEYTRKIFAMGSPVNWPAESRDKILAVLGLRARIVIEVAEG